MKHPRQLATLCLALLLLVTLTGNVAAQEESGGQRFAVSIDAVANFPYKDSGSFTTAVGAAAPGPAMPGQAFEFTFSAVPGDRLSFATMLAESNDYFFAPNELGIPLYGANGAAMSGDVTSYVKLWDAGTEADQPPGMGPDQAPRQAAPNTGAADPMPMVRRVLTDRLPAENQLIQVTLQALGSNRFHLRIENISGSSALHTPISPGVWVVHTDPAPLFVNGRPDRGMGLEAIAEDGNAIPLAAMVEVLTGINTPLSPLAWAVHTQPNLLFTPGQQASAGLERIAEDGMPDVLAASLAGAPSGAVSVGRGASGPGPIMPPTGNFSFEITAAPGELLSLATMYGESNDWFYALSNQPLFDANGQPVQGSFTQHIRLYDAGTEVNEPPGFGPNQAPRQPAPNTGPAEGGVVQMVTQMRFTNPARVIHVTITPIR